MNTDFKRRVLDFHAEVLGGSATARLETLPSLFAVDYSPQLPAFRGISALAPGRAALAGRLASLGAVPHRVARVLADGNLVLAHVQYPGDTPVAGVDIYEFDQQGLIGRHWNVRQPLPRDSGAGDDRFETNRAYAIADSLDPNWLKARVREMLMEFWGKGRGELIDEFYSESYVQHNAEMPGGYQRIREIVQNDIPRYIQATGGPFPIQIHHLVAEGDLVGVHLSIFMAGINRNDGERSTNVDIFRVNRDGRMVEHWDVLQIDGVALPASATQF